MHESINPIIHKTLKYSSKKPDCFILTHLNTIVQIVEIKKATTNQPMIIIGKTFLEKEDLFTEPLKSSQLSIYIIRNLSEDLNHWNMSDINNKMIVFNFKNKLIAIPIILHD